MAYRSSAYINRNINNNNYVMPGSKEDKGNHLYDRVLEDPASPSSTATIPEMMDLSQDCNEGSRSTSVASQHGSDSSSSEHSAADEHPYQDMDQMSPSHEDKPMTFENCGFCPPGFHLRRRQSTSTSPTSLKFPHGTNIGENNNFEEDYEIFMYVKVRA